MASVFSTDSVKSSFPFWNEYLTKFAPKLPTAYRLHQPLCGSVKRKVPDGKEHKSSEPRGKKLNFKTFIVMIYSNFTGRVAKDAKLVDGVNGQFLSMDLAVNDFSKGEEVTQWVRVQTSDPAHIKLVQYFTKGKILTIHGNIKIDQWEGKDGTPRAQLRVHAKNIDFLNIGKKPVTDNNVPDAPTDTPKEKKDDLPF